MSVICRISSENNCTTLVLDTLIHHHHHHVTVLSSRASMKLIQLSYWLKSVN